MGSAMGSGPYTLYFGIDSIMLGAVEIPDSVSLKSNGHGILYRDSCSTLAPSKVLTLHPCPFGLTETLTVAQKALQMVQRTSYIARALEAEPATEEVVGYCCWLKRQYRDLASRRGRSVCTSFIAGGILQRYLGKRLGKRLEVGCCA